MSETLVALALTAVGGGCVGYALHALAVARRARQQADALREVVRRGYATTPDGRRTDRLPAGRYGEGD